MIKKYVTCDLCKIGGYVNCPQCLGSGGYTVDVEESALSGFDSIDREVSNIKKRLQLVEDSHKWNPMISQKLVEDYEVLKSKPCTDAVLAVIRRIESIREGQTKKQLLDLLENHVHFLEDIKVLVHHRPSWSTYSFSPNTRMLLSDPAYILSLASMDTRAHLSLLVFKEFLSFLERHAACRISGGHLSIGDPSSALAILQGDNLHLIRIAIQTQMHSEYMYLRVQDFESIALIFIKSLKADNKAGWVCK